MAGGIKDIQNRTGQVKAQWESDFCPKRRGTKNVILPVFSLGWKVSEGWVFKINMVFVGLIQIIEGKKRVKSVLTNTNPIGYVGFVAVDTDNHRDL